MAQRSREHLRVTFRDGERPSGSDFADLFDSFLSKTDDRVDVDADDNLDIPGGLNLGNSSSGQAGTLRFRDGNVQYFDGANWNNVGGGGGAFTPVDGGPHVAFNERVGIGNFDSPPEYRLDVQIGMNTGENERVRIGNAVISNGQGASQSAAQFSHQNHAAGNNNFALRQGQSGEVHLNAAANQPITISQNRLQTRLLIDRDGEVVIGSNSTIPGAGNAILQVNGNAFKSQGGGQWATASDARMKTDISDFKDGLNKLMKVRPVRFRYNGRFNTNTEQEEVGVIGQEIRNVFPYMTDSVKVESGAGTRDDQLDDVLTFNGHALTYVMVNAIQELAGKVDELKKKIRTLENRNGNDETD